MAKTSAQIALRSGPLVPLEAILRTEELTRRPSRRPDYATENRALTALVQALADSPRTVPQTLADTILKALDADSSGISLLTKDKKSFEWIAIAGAWQPHLGGGTPRDFGPCGDVLDCNAPLLFTHWERRYPYLLEAVPLAEEGLLVPFFVKGKAVGTIWAIAHSNRRRFDAEDLRQLESLGRFASGAYQKTVEFRRTQDGRRAALNLMEDAVQSRQSMEKLNVALRESEDRLAKELAAVQQLQERQQLLLNELAHRGKNLLAVIQTIVSRSLSGTRSLAEEREALMQRIQALARSQTVLVNGSFEGASLSKIIGLEFEAFSGRVAAAGPDVMLNPKVAQTFALLAHELATNATKYGALSQPGGSIAIAWSIEGNGAEARFKFQWQERDGPPVVPPTRQGFGRVLIERAAAQDFGARPRISYAPEGLSYEIDAPLSALAASAEARS